MVDSVIYARHLNSLGQGEKTWVLPQTPENTFYQNGFVVLVLDFFLIKQQQF